MTTYKLTTRYARYEGGEYVFYPSGSSVDLSLEELEQFAPGVATRVSTNTGANRSDEKGLSEDVLDVTGLPVDSRRGKADSVISTPSQEVFRTTLSQPKKEKHTEEVDKEDEK